MKVELNQADVDKIQKYVEEGRYPDIEDFVKQAVKSLLYAEDRKEEFMKMLGKNK